MENSQLEMQAKLFAKINAISLAVGVMPEKGENKHQKYNYVTAYQMKEAVRIQCEKHKVCIVPSVISQIERDFMQTETTNYGGKEQTKEKITTRSIVEMCFEIIDIETGFSRSFQFTGADQDLAGKSMQQAQTACVKNFYFNIFKVSTKDDSKDDSHTPIIENVVAPKQPITVERFAAMVIALQEGKTTFEKVKNAFAYTDNQIAKLKELGYAI